MADEKQTTQTPKPVAESTAFDKNGKLQPGYGYRYETVRTDDGRAETRKVVFKVGS